MTQKLWPWTLAPAGSRELLVRLATGTPDLLDPQAAANALTASRCSTSSASTNQRWPGPKVNLKDVGVLLPHKATHRHQLTSTRAVQP